MRALIPVGLLALSLAALSACSSELSSSSGTVASSHDGAPPLPDPGMEQYNGDLPELGSQLPAFSVETLDGRTIDNAAIAGKTTLINFWFHGCAPCRKELPEVQKMWSEIEDRDDLLIVAVNSGVDDRETIEGYWKKQGYTFDALFGDGGESSTSIGVRAYPTNVVVDPEGKVLWASVGYDEHAIKYYMGI